MVEGLERGGIPSSAQMGTGASGKNTAPDAGLPFVSLKIGAEADIAKEEVRRRLIEEILSNGAVLRKEEHKKRARVYKDGTKQYTLRLIRQEMDVTTVKEMENRTPNLSVTKKIINKKARVYLDSPARIAKAEAAMTASSPKKPGKKTETTPDQIFLDDFVEALHLDHFMKTVNRKLELHWNLLVAPRPVQDPDEPGKYTIELEAFSPEYYDVVADNETGRKPLVVIFSYFAYAANDIGTPTYRSGVSVQPETAGSKNEKNSNPERHFVFWSRNYHFVTDMKGSIIAANSPEETEPSSGLPLNPIGRMPFVVICKDQDGSFWSEGGEDLVDNSILINLLMADMFYIQKFQGMGILFATGKNVPKSLSVGPGRMIGMSYDGGDEPEPKLTAVNPGAPIADHLSMIEQFLAFVLSTNDLEPGSIQGKLETPRMANSGIQEIIQKSEISTAIEDEQEIFKIKEQDILNIALAWLKLYGGKSLMNSDFSELKPPVEDKLDYTLTFDSTQPVVNEKDHITTLTLKKASGLFTLSELIAEAHPDLSTEEVQGKIAELDKEDTAKIAKAQANMKQLGGGGALPPKENTPPNNEEDPNNKQGENQQ